MSDFNLRSYPYAGIVVPSESPFFPVIKGEGETATVAFNQGYVFDYQNKGEAFGMSGIKPWKVALLDGSAAHGNFYLTIETDPTSAAIISVTMGQFADGSAPDAIEEFHYSAGNITNGATVYDTGEGTFRIPICKLENGIIKEVYLRENIHWQKINFANTDSDEGDASFGVLINWGDEAVFSDNPTVKFAKIVQKTDEKVIKVEASESKLGIVITTQFPDVPAGVPSVLYRGSDDAWHWLSSDPAKNQILVTEAGEPRWLDVPTDGGLLYAYGGDLTFLPFPDEGSAEAPAFLSYQGGGADSLKWVQSQTCDTGESP